MEPVTEVIHPIHGKVHLHGSGPWSVKNTSGTFTIVDANGEDARPTVWRRISYGTGNATKPDANVIWAKGSTPAEIVAQANAELTVP